MLDGVGLMHPKLSNCTFRLTGTHHRLYAAPNSACNASSLSSAMVATTVIAREISPGASSATVREDNTTTWLSKIAKRDSKVSDQFISSSLRINSGSFLAGSGSTEDQTAKVSSSVEPLSCTNTSTLPYLNFHI